MRRIALTVLTLAALALLALQPAAAQQTVKVGAYHFPPYAVNTADGMGGLVADLVTAMNAVQDDYAFEVVPTSALTRYEDLAEGKFDLIAFESIDWGWQGKGVTASDVYMGGEEVYVARIEEGRGQGFFDDIAGRRIAAVYGFHYGFADFNADPGYMETTFSVEQPLNPCTSLYYVMDGRVELAVVSRLFLDVFLNEYPEFQGKFLVSDKADQVYRHTILVKDGGATSVEEVNALLAELRSSGALDRMVEAYLF